MTKYKLFLSLSIAFISADTVHAQKNDDYRFKDIQHDYIKISRPSEQINFPVNFTQIHVYDQRRDTTHMGLPYTKSVYITELRTRQSLAEEVKINFDLLNGGIKENKENVELFCFINKLSLSDFITAPLDAKDKKEAEGKFDMAEKSGVKIQIEFFVKKGTDFIPAYRFDSAVTGEKEIFKKGDDYLEYGLTASLKKAATLNWEKILNSSRKLKWKDIEDYYDYYGNTPIFKYPPAKGVFVSFKDFKNNKVTYTDFSVSKDSKGDFLYLKNPAGEETLLTDLWGYSDGEEIFIYSANNFFKLFRSGYSYRFYGAKDYNKSRIMRLNFRPIDLVNPNSAYSKSTTRATYNLVMNFLQLDMESGELY